MASSTSARLSADGRFHLFGRVSAQLAQGFGADGRALPPTSWNRCLQLYFQGVLAFHGKHGCHVVVGEQRARLIGIRLSYARIGRSSCAWNSAGKSTVAILGPTVSRRE